jgi:signal peptidase I
MVLGFILWLTVLINAIQTAKRLQKYAPRATNRWFVYTGVFALAALVSVPTARALGVRAFKVPSESMLPTLHVGDYFIARLESPQSYSDNRGDILVYLYPGDNSTHYVHRVVAFAGEEIEIRDGRILIDGKPVAEPWAKIAEQSLRNPHYTFGPRVVPDGTVYMLGDNIENAADSRIWGPLPRENIVGVAEYIYLSWDSRNKRVRFNRVGLDL